jgi:RHS repeat-associated protein
MKTIITRLLMLTCLLVSVASSQTNMSAPNDVAATENHGIDSINLQNLSVSLNLPIRSRGGISFSDKATSLCGMYDSGDSNFYASCTTGFGSVRPTSRPVVTSNHALLDSGVAYTINAYVTNPIYYCTNINNLSSKANQYTSFYLADAFGSTHPLPSTDSLYVALSGQAACKDKAYTYIFPDGSGMTVTVQTTNGGTPTWVAYTPSGEYATGPGRAFTVTDANGNTITETAPGTTYLDPLGASYPVLSISGADGTTPGTYSWKDVNGGTQSVTETYSNKTIQTSFGCVTATDKTPYSQNVVTQLSYPDGGVSGLSYEANGGNITGRLDTITLRTGGTVRYQYSGGSHGIDCTYFVPPTMTRTTPDGTWTYNWVSLNFGSGKYGNSTTVIDPGKNEKVYQFTGLTATGPAALPVAQVLTQVGTYQNVGTVSNPAYSLLGYDVICYNGIALANCPTATVSYPITKKQVYHYVANNTYPSMTETDFDVYGNVTAQLAFDFAASTATRATTINYGSYGSGSCTQISTYINNRPCQVITKNNFSGNTIAQTYFVYDGSGNRTATWKWTGGSNWLVPAATYNANGTVSKTTDPNTTTTTTYTYGDCNGFFPTQTQIKSSGTVLATASATAYCDGLVPHTTTDVNRNQTTYSYADGSVADPFWRVLTATDPAGSVVDIDYGITGNHTTVLFGSSTIDLTSWLDSSGRPVVSAQEQGPGSNNYDTVTSSYGFNGTNWSTTSSTPCVTAGSDGTCPYSTMTIVDPLGRPISTTDPDGGYVAYSYVQNNPSAFLVDSKITLGPAPSGENLKSFQSEYDGLGRVKSVCRISSGAGSCGQANSANGYPTTMSYTDANGSTTVTATRGVQTRTKQFDAAGRLVYESNPEGGAVSYVYDSDTSCTVAGSKTSSLGDLISSTDANGNKTCRTYDALHRLTDVVVTNSQGVCVSPTKRFRYDNTSNAILLTPSGYAGSNLVGKVFEAWTGDCTWPTPNNGANTGADEWFSYDVVGQMTDLWESTPHIAGYYHGTTGYAPNGAITSIGGIPGYAAMTYGLDGEGRPYTATQGSTNIVTGVNYTASGQTQNIYIGAGDSDNYSYDSQTGRPNNWTFTVGATPKSQTGTLNWNPNGTLGSLVIGDGFNAGGAMTCSFGYDDLARLTTDNCGSSVWNQTFAFDPYDNITKTGNPGTTWAPGYNSANNHALGTSYDSNGNLTNDGSHNYSWYPDNKLQSVDSTTCTIFTSSNGTCVIYDAFGRLAETGVNGQYHEVMYTPAGKAAIMSGMTVVQDAYFPLPGGATIHETNGGVTKEYWHKDYLGSVRLASRITDRVVNFDRSFSSYGETITNFGSGSGLNFTGDTQDIFAGLFSTPNRELSAVQGRWMSPDPARSGWNLYAYGTDPNTSVDPSGLGDRPTISVEIIGADCNADCSLETLQVSSSMGSNGFSSPLDSLISSSVPDDSVTSEAGFSDLSSFTPSILPSGSGSAGEMGTWGQALFNPGMSQFWGAAQSFVGHSAVSMGVGGVVGGLAGVAIGEFATGVREGLSEPFGFFNIKNSQAIFTLSDTPAAELTSGRTFISKHTIESTGETYISRYWEAKDGSGMWRQSNHWGGLNGGSNWSLVGPNGVLASPNEFRMFTGEMPTGFIRFDEMSPNIFDQYLNLP